MEKPVKDKVDFEEQIALELESRVLGINRYEKNNEKKKQRNQEATTDYAKSLVKHYILPVSKRLDEYIKTEKAKNSPVLRAKAIEQLLLIESDVAATITLKTLLNHATRNKPATSTFIKIGKCILDEINCIAFEEQNPNLFAKIYGDLKSRNAGYEYSRRKYLEAAQRDGQERIEWNVRDKLRVGRTLYVIVESVSNLFYERDFRKGKRVQKFLSPTDKCMQWIKEKKIRGSILFPERFPTIVTPKDWTEPRGGGYYTKHQPALTFVKTNNNNYLDELKSINIQNVYDAVNICQKTPFVINRKILKVQKHFWEQGHAVGSIPGDMQDEKPIKPSEEQLKDKDMLRRYKAAMTIWYGEVERHKSKQIQCAKTFELADKFYNYKFYFPYQLDFRGRLYATTAFLNPQGADYQKALLTFANSKPIHDDEQGHKAAGWLMIHGANTYGYDKCDYQERIEFIIQHEEQIEECSKDPFGCKFWHNNVSDPWQFLAFCFEYTAFKNYGYGYESSLPISLDATCSGLQHFSASIRSSVTGKQVNMVPNKIPADIYQKVADNVKLRLEKDTHEFAQKWLKYGIDRAITKRPTMTICYGSRQYSWSNFINEIVTKKKEIGHDQPFGDKLLKANNYLAKIMWDVASEVIEAATKVMKWLQTVARIASQEGIPIVWYTPMGFPVQQAYENYKPLQIQTRLMGKVFRPQLKVPNNNLDNKWDKRKQSAGVSPNFVHALDSCHLQMTLCHAFDQGINNFSMVHDSYGTLAADTESLTMRCRETFVDLYKSHDVLIEFRNDIIRMLPESKRETVPMPPEKGDLDITGVLDSEFFFS